LAIFLIISGKLLIIAEGQFVLPDSSYNDQEFLQALSEKIRKI
jgi:hypothetical protein